jgi:hypothetical protein
MAKKLMIGRHHLNTPLGRQNRNNLHYREERNANTRCTKPLTTLVMAIVKVSPRGATYK